MIARLLLILVLLIPATARADASVRTDHLTFTLITEKSGITKGEAEGFRAGILMEPEPGWHTYWENPGDAGLPTTLTWSLPEGFTASHIDWPAPTRMNEGPLAIYAYDGTTLLPVTITPRATTDHEVTLKVRAEALVCKDICIPASADLELTLPVSTTPSHPSPSAHHFQQQNIHHVIMVDDPSGFKTTEKTLTLTIPLKDLTPAEPGAKPPAFTDIRAAQFFPREQNIVQYATDQMLSGDRKFLNITLERAIDGPTPERLSGILSITLPSGTKSYNLTFLPKTMPTLGNQPTTLVFPVALLLALIGGIILNLMPCVLPVLFLKAFSLAKKSGHDHQIVIRQGAAYTFGISISFALISGILIALRAGGESIGWGYQMQSPAFIASLIYLLFVLGLSLSGVFYLPVLLGGIGNDASNKPTARGSFITGVLATAVATPCTAPFMAPAIGAALTMPAWQAMLVFQALGLGLALPYLLVCIFPAVRGMLPRPGAWMDKFKQLMAFPMYASAIWLMWVLTLQTGVSGMVITLTTLLFFVIVIWLRVFFPPISHAYRVVSILLSLTALAISLPMLSRLDATPTLEQPTHITSIPYSKEALATLRAAGKPVFVDATAAWCITCQVNASVALHTTRTMAAFKEHGITLMIADWTRRNDEITDFLAQFGFNGVPLNAFYPPGDADPIILPQILSEDIVIQTITPKGK